MKLNKFVSVMDYNLTLSVNDSFLRQNKILVHSIAKLVQKLCVCVVFPNCWNDIRLQYIYEIPYGNFTSQTTCAVTYLA